jgi:hypothetical protein
LWKMQATLQNRCRNNGEGTAPPWRRGSLRGTGAPF